MKRLTEGMENPLRRPLWEHPKDEEEEEEKVRKQVLCAIGDDTARLNQRQPNCVE